MARKKKDNPSRIRTGIGKDDESYIIGTRIKDRRELISKKESIKTQKEFYETHDISIETAGQWERHENIPKIEKALDLSKILDCDVQYLYGLQDEPRKNTIEAAEYIGISADAVDRLREIGHGSILDDKHILNTILSSEAFYKTISLLSAIAIKKKECANHMHTQSKAHPVPDKSGFISISNYDEYNSIYGPLSEGRDEAYYYYANRSEEIKKDILDIISSAIDELSYKSLDSANRK